MPSRTQHIAACLGIDEGTIRRLQARGYLLKLDLTGAEVRERLYRAHRRYVLGRSARVQKFVWTRAPEAERSARVLDLTEQTTAERLAAQSTEGP